MSYPPPGQVGLSCEATIAGEKIQVSLLVTEELYSIEEARDQIRAGLREELMREILKKWTPVIRVERA